MAFGSCRVSVPHDEAGTEAFGVDALRAYALHMAGDDAEKWPDLVLFLGDQVYADETSDEMREFIASRRSLDEPPGEELKDYEEYAHLYDIAWSDPANRWLLSTLPSAMIFDDHDIRDDWNTSWSWRQDMESTPWWHDRIVGGLASYWVYQHLGNLEPRRPGRGRPLAADLSLRRAGRAGHHGGPRRPRRSTPTGSPTATGGASPATSAPRRGWWSSTRGPRGVLKPKERSILDPAEMEWFDDQMRGGFDHVIVGTSLPFLLAPGLHHVEAFGDGLAAGAWGKGRRADRRAATAWSRS